MKWLAIDAQSTDEDTALTVDIAVDYEGDLDLTTKEGILCLDREEEEDRVLMAVVGKLGELGRGHKNSFVHALCYLLPIKPLDKSTKT